MHTTMSCSAYIGPCICVFSTKIIMSLQDVIKKLLFFCNKLYLFYKMKPSLQCSPHRIWQHSFQSIKHLWNSHFGVAFSLLCDLPYLLYSHKKLSSSFLETRKITCGLIWWTRRMHHWNSVICLQKNVQNTVRVNHYHNAIPRIVYQFVFFRLPHTVNMTFQ